MVERISESVVEKIFLLFLACFDVEIDSDQFECSCEECEHYEDRCRCDDIDKLE
jgi:hypothetical protein